MFAGPPEVIVVGGGLAGCEASWLLAELGHRVVLVDMKPAVMSPAHQSPHLCELVCSNSLRSDAPQTPAGVLKAELRGAGSLVIACADQHKVPAGAALAVDRDGFAAEVSERLRAHANVRIESRVVDELPEGPAILATGPLTGGRLAQLVEELLGGDRWYFYDAIAPIVGAESIDATASFHDSRWDDSEGGDYINCPLTAAEYYEFVRALLAGDKVSPRDFEEPRYFEGCLPIEVMAGRGEDVLRHGPMRPMGLRDPATGKRPFAVVQLRPENRYLSAYNLVGFQTRLTYPEQRRIFSMIPALAHADFMRMGSIHRNTYIDSPRVLGAELELLSRPELLIAGLITGVEGYIESCAMGLLAGLFTAAQLRNRTVDPPPATTAMGGLYRHLTMPREPDQHFAPTNINFGLLPRLAVKAPKRERKQLIAARAGAEFAPWWRAQDLRKP